MGSLSILFLLWVAKRRTCLEGGYASLPFPNFAATPSFGVSQLDGESRLKSLLNIAWFPEETHLTSSEF